MPQISTQPSLPSLSSLVIASGNAGKIAEFTSLLAPLGIAVSGQAAFDVPECAEPFDTFLENSLHKARHASRHSGMPALADDSGLIVEALGGKPGVLSARYATLHGLEKSDANNNQCLLSALQSYPAPQGRTARFFTVLTLVRFPDDPAPIVSQAYWQGEILKTPAGVNGFGYDPLFWIPDLGRSAAELTPQEKNQFSHRGQALRMLIEQLRAAGFIQDEC